MTTYAFPWPWAADRFEMRVVSNQRVYGSAFNPASQQVVDLGGDYWAAKLSVPSNDRIRGEQIEALIDLMRGAQNSVSLYHVKRPVPRGTMRDGVAATWVTPSAAAVTWNTFSAGVATWTAGDPALKNAVAQYATSCTLKSVPGRTLEPGDLFGLPNGQTVRYCGLTPAVTDGSGDMVISDFAPSARSAMAAYGHVTWNRPTVSYRLRDGGEVPLAWLPGQFEGITLDLIEAL